MGHTAQCSTSTDKYSPDTVWATRRSAVPAQTSIHQTPCGPHGAVQYQHRQVFTRHRVGHTAQCSTSTDKYSPDTVWATRRSAVPVQTSIHQTRVGHTAQCSTSTDKYSPDTVWATRRSAVPVQTAERIRQQNVSIHQTPCRPLDADSRTYQTAERKYSPDTVSATRRRQ